MIRETISPSFVIVVVHATNVKGRRKLSPLFLFWFVDKVPDCVNLLMTIIQWQVLHQYINYVKPAFEEFCMPTKKFADVIIPRGPENK